MGVVPHGTSTEDDVHRWRLQRFLELGVPSDVALRIARQKEPDLHEVAELVERGCDAELAVRIRE